MKTTFKLDSHLADLSNSTISIIGIAPENNPYVRIQLPDLKNVTSTNTCLFIEDKDLERFAVNILKALNSNELKQLYMGVGAYHHVTPDGLVHCQLTRHLSRAGGLFYSYLESFYIRQTLATLITSINTLILGPIE